MTFNGDGSLRNVTMNPQGAVDINWTDGATPVASGIKKFRGDFEALIKKKKSHMVPGLAPAAPTLVGSGV